MDTFWTKGYGASSVQDLLDAMGINRGSMYDTFGDKHALFSEAFDHYTERQSGQLASVLESPGSPLGNVRNLLDVVVGLATDGRGRGCMVTNSIVELASCDPMVADALESLFERIGDNIRHTLNRAVEAGEMAPEANTSAQTRFVMTTVHGLTVLGKSGRTRKELNDVIDVAMLALS
jgi:TetR/AcrR family transcriptional repressor of nem operon